MRHGCNQILPSTNGITKYKIAPSCRQIARMSRPLQLLLDFSYFGYPTYRFIIVVHGSPSLAAIYKTGHERSLDIVWFRCFSTYIHKGYPQSVFFHNPYLPFLIAPAVKMRLHVLLFMMSLLTGISLARLCQPGRAGCLTRGNKKYAVFCDEIYFANEIAECIPGCCKVENGGTWKWGSRAYCAC